MEVNGKMIFINVENLIKEKDNERERESNRMRESDV